MKTFKTKTYSFPVIIEESKDGFYAECPVLEACYTQGDSYEEATKNIREVIDLCLAT
jgi:predicted RNase H-like HicB family nuclease